METSIKSKLNKLPSVLFYIALFIELVLMIVEKSEISFGYESYVFRLTFLITLLSVFTMKHTRKEWGLIVLIWLFTVISYKLSGKNDLLRIATFVMAARDIDLKKAIRFVFGVSVAGFGVIALLAVLGLYGDISLTTDFGRSVGEETRFVFGFGHPNTLFSSAYFLMLVWLWLYGESSKLYHFIISFVLLGIISIITVSRTGMLILAVTFIAALFMKLFPNTKSYKAPYIITTILSPVLCVVASVLAAILSEMAYFETLPGTSSWYFFKLDEKLNYRISSLYFSPNHDAVFSHWKLFAAHDTDAFFDMGWVRIFYWYGIIPTVVIIAFIFLFCYLCWKQKDIYSMVIIFSLGIYTLVEATFVSRYIGRNFMLIVFAVYLGDFIHNKLKST